MINYYSDIADYILPYLKDRPESLHRFPDGIEGEEFFQKNMEDLPPWVKAVDINSESENKKVHYLICQDKATLIYMANLASIEINPWLSRVGHLDKPDFLVIDLDPEDISFSAVIKVARAAKKVLDELKVKGYPKTSGARGIHIYLPLGAKYTYERSKKFGELLAKAIHAKLPKITSLERLPENRQGKVYIDWLQNAEAQTVAAPYSVRPVPGAQVSTPLKWEEVKEGLDPKDFNIKNIKNRLQKTGDLFAPVLKESILIKI